MNTQITKMSATAVAYLMQDEAGDVLSAEAKVKANAWNGVIISWEMDEEDTSLRDCPVTGETDVMANVTFTTYQENYPLTTKTFVSNLNLLRLRFQDIQRDLVELSTRAAADGVLAEQGIIDSDGSAFDDMYELFAETATVAGQNWDENPWTLLNDPEALGALMIEEYEQAHEKAHELADMAKIDHTCAQFLLEDVGYCDYPVEILKIMQDEDLKGKIAITMKHGFTSVCGQVTRTFSDYSIKSVTFAEDHTVYGVYFLFDEPIVIGEHSVEGHVEAYIIR